MPKIFVVSDGTGTTADTVARAALAQFDTQVEVVKYPNTRSERDIQNVIDAAAPVGGLVIHTLVSEDLRRKIYNLGRQYNVPTIDLLGPLLMRLSETLSAAPSIHPGAFKPFETGYLSRVDALDYTVRHDDGHHRADVEQADLVLVGVSGTAKTPLSIYLAYRGLKVANIPLILGIPKPENLLELPKERVFGLWISPDHLHKVRLKTDVHPGISPLFYRDQAYIEKECAYADEFFSEGRWQIIEMGHKSVEEAAADILMYVGER